MGAGRALTLVHVDMRKALPRDVKKESIIPLKHAITPDDLEWNT